MIHKESFIKGYCSACNAERKKKCDGRCDGLNKELEYYNLNKEVSDGNKN